MIILPTSPYIYSLAYLGVRVSLRFFCYYFNAMWFKSNSSSIICYIRLDSLSIPIIPLNETTISQLSTSTQILEFPFSHSLWTVSPVSNFALCYITYLIPLFLLILPITLVCAQNCSCLIQQLSFFPCVLPTPVHLPLWDQRSDQFSYSTLYPSILWC